MRGAKFREGALCLFLSVLAIASCGGRVEPTTSAADTDASIAPPIPTTIVTPFFDAGTTSFGFDGGAPGFPPVANGPNDTSPACSSRTPYDCECSGEDCPPTPDNALEDLVQLCNEIQTACGYIYVDFDSSGCAIDLRMDNPQPSFIECMDARLNSNRWQCDFSQGTQARAYVDCTTRGR
jgi:hypothetical protein